MRVTQPNRLAVGTLSLIVAGAIGGGVALGLSAQDTPQHVELRQVAATPTANATTTGTPTATAANTQPTATTPKVTRTAQPAAPKVQPVVTAEPAPARQDRTQTGRSRTRRADRCPVPAVAPVHVPPRCAFNSTLLTAGYDLRTASTHSYDVPEGTWYHEMTAPADASPALIRGNSSTTWQARARCRSPRWASTTSPRWASPDPGCHTR